MQRMQDTFPPRKKMIFHPFYLFRLPVSQTTRREKKCVPSMSKHPKHLGEGCKKRYESEKMVKEQRQLKTDTNFLSLSLLIHVSIPVTLVTFFSFPAHALLSLTNI